VPPGTGETAGPGELIYEYKPRVMQVVEYGLAADAVLMRQLAPPAEGARLDLYLEGPVVAGRLKGKVRAVDYLNFRADGRAELHIHGEITTEDGKNVALTAGGVAIPEGDSSIFQLREHVELVTNHPELSWVNSAEVWARGNVDVATGEVHLRAYAV
jgi:hypothetical protein